jgi:hypothetical protein
MKGSLKILATMFILSAMFVHKSNAANAATGYQIANYANELAGYHLWGAATDRCAIYKGNIVKQGDKRRYKFKIPSGQSMSKMKQAFLALVPEVARQQWQEFAQFTSEWANDYRGQRRRSGIEKQSKGSSQILSAFALHAFSVSFDGVVAGNKLWAAANGMCTIVKDQHGFKVFWKAPHKATTAKQQFNNMPVATRTNWQKLATLVAEWNKNATGNPIAAGVNIPADKAQILNAFNARFPIQ